MPVDELAIGFIKTSYGVHGYVKIHTFSGETDHLFSLNEITLKNGKNTAKKNIQDVASKGNNLLIKLEGVDTPEDARKYSKWELWTTRENGAALYADEYYAADICRCSLVKDTKVYGKVKAVCNGYQTEMLEVCNSENKTFLIPFMEPYIGEIDITAGTIELKTEWLLE